MDLREIRYVLAIDKHASITKAAEDLHITQPALSKFLMNLEQEVGASLFTRVSDGLHPTQVGQRYLHYAKEIRLSQENWNRENIDLRNETKGILRIAIPPIRSSTLVPKALSIFYKHYPDVRVTLMEASHNVENYAEGTDAADFIIYGCNSPLSHLHYEVLGEEELILLANSQYGLAQYGEKCLGATYENMPLHHVAKLPFILNIADQTTGAVGRKVLQQAGISPEILLETRNSQVSIQMAASGLGLTLVPETYLSVLQLPDPPQRFSIGNPSTKIMLCVAHMPNSYLPSYAKFFIEVVSGVFETLLAK